MSQYRSERRRAARPGVKAADCPCVADLIEFAEGRLGNPIRQRIEAHLKDTGCAYCQSWIARAGDPPITSTRAALQQSPPAAFRQSPPAAAGPPAKRDNPEWQRQAFLGLEKRLRELEEQ